MIKDLYTLPPGNYCAYLRKSRADHEAESRGEEETYAKHTRILLDLAKRYNINLTKIYKEKPISGERISARAEMLQLLEDIEAGEWQGVLVVEVERLARGDTMDQGIVAQAFKYSNTLIVTPMRVYDPNNSDDEEYFEFGLFMSRREFKTTTRRLQSGRIVSVDQGKYVGNIPPYGYNRIKNPHGKGFTLEPHPEQAPIVQLIFSFYTDPDPEKRKGTALIAAYLNELKVPSARNKKWTVATVNGIIRNPTYIGRVRWGSRPIIKRRDGKSRPRKPRDQWRERQGLHPPIIDEQVYQQAQSLLEENGHAPAPAGKITNPMAGLVKCDICGAAIVYKAYSGRKNQTPATLLCSTQYCKNKSAYYYLVEEKLLKALEDWLSTYKAQWEATRPIGSDRNEQAKVKAIQEMMKNQTKRLNELTEQKNNLHDLVERKVYTIDVFLERSQVISRQIEEVKESLSQSEKELEIEQKRITARVETIPKVEYVLGVYHQTESPAAKNDLLRSVLEKVVYRKDVGGRWSGAIDQFELTLYPKLSKG
jgi:DNA invertase Pin-like site-specific DNA recombinase/uncharacterized protein YoxC